MQKLSVELYPQRNQIVQDAYDALVVSLYACEPFPKSLCVTGSAPGSGKTTISINLAISFVMSGRSALLVDADIRKTSRFKRLGEADFLGLSDLLSGHSDFSEVVTSTNLENLDFITSGNKTAANPLGLLYSPRFDYLLKTALETYDLLIFDTSSLDANADSSVIASKMDGTLLVTEKGSSIRMLEKNIDHLVSIGANVIGTVLNKLPKNEYKGYMEFYNYRHSERKNKNNRRAEPHGSTNQRSREG